MKQEERQWQSKVMTVIFGVAIAIAATILIVSLIIFARNQCNFSGRFDEALLAVKDSAQRDTNVGKGEDLHKNIEYLEQLHLLQKNSASTDLFVFLYAFLSSIFIGLGTYYVSNSKKQLETAQEKYNEMEKKAAHINTQFKEIQETSRLTLARARLQKPADCAMHMLSMLTSFTVCADSTLQNLVYEFLPRIHEQMEWIKDEISALTSEDCKTGDDAVLKSALNGIMYCAGQCKGRHALLNEAQIKEIQQFSLDCVKKLNDKLIEKA